VSTHDQAGWCVLLLHTPERAYQRPYYAVIGPFLSRPAATNHARQEAARDPDAMARVLYAEGKPFPKTAWRDAVPISPS
jgi:hypothetical protein